MELIRGHVSSNLGAALANAFLQDLEVMNLLKTGIDAKHLLVDKSKIDREKARMKLKSEGKHREGRLNQLVCIGVDTKVDKETLLFMEVEDENRESKLKKENG
jgi:hypothetical protein